MHMLKGTEWITFCQTEGGFYLVAWPKWPFFEANDKEAQQARIRVTFALMLYFPYFNPLTNEHKAYFGSIFGGQIHFDFNLPEEILHFGI